MNRYYKNFILCGDIDQYCLLCKESFHLIPDIEKHIRWENHRKHLKNLSYLPKFRKDLIYKIDDLYYCELCNLITFNMASAMEHSKSEKHTMLKKNPDAAEIKKPAGLCESGYVIINKVILTKAQWNSVFNKKCLICDIDVKDFDKHIATPEHVIKLIQSQTKYVDNQYYRKINEDTYHCFACKKVFTRTNFESHWVSCENSDEIVIKQLREAKTTRNINALTDVSQMVELELDLVKALNDFYQIDEDKNMAFCRNCKSTMAIDFKSMLIHMKENHDKEETKRSQSSSDESAPEEVVYMEVADNGKKRSELAKYGREHNIKLNHIGARGYCSICDRHISAHKTLFKEHVKGAIHRGHLELLGLKKPKDRPKVYYNPKSMKEYIDNVQYSSEMQILLVNGDFCVAIDSFFLLYPNPHNKHSKTTKCFACNEVFPQGNELRHCLTSKHRDNVIAAKVVMKKDEFIREIRTNLFHCGFCNATIPYAKLLERHIKSINHKMHVVEHKMQMPNKACFIRKFDVKTDDMITEDRLYRHIMQLIYGIWPFVFA